MRYWQDSMIVVLGGLLIVAPWVFGFADDRMAVAGMSALGALTVALAFGAIAMPRAWETRAEVVMGLVTIGAPWLFGFQALQQARGSVSVAGAMVAGLAVWSLLVNRPTGKGTPGP